MFEGRQPPIQRERTHKGADSVFESPYAAALEEGESEEAGLSAKERATLEFF